MIWRARTSGPMAIWAGGPGGLHGGAPRPDGRRTAGQKIVLAVERGQRASQES
jgi:hypothetical protein